MNYYQWIQRISQRSDLTAGLVHLTKGNDIMTAQEVLFKILKEGKLKGSTTRSGFICGDIEAVCLQDTPLYCLAQNVYFEGNSKVSKERYKAFGIRFEKNLYTKKVEDLSFMIEQKMQKDIYLRVNGENSKFRFK